MDGLAGDSHVETCSPRAFSGQQATILDPIEGSRGRRCQLSPSVSNNVLGLLSVTAKDDNHRWRRDSISETCTRNALVGLRQSMWIIERVGAAHDLRGGESPRIAADGLSTHKVIFDHTCTKPKNYRVHPRNAFSAQWELHNDLRTSENPVGFSVFMPATYNLFLIRYCSMDRTIGF